jgi:hypothetical protein
VNRRRRCGKGGFCFNHGEHGGHGEKQKQNRVKEALNYSPFVIPAKAGIQENQRTGPRPSPGRRINQHFLDHGDTTGAAKGKTLFLVFRCARRVRCG